MGPGCSQLLGQLELVQVQPQRWRHDVVGGFDLAAGGHAELRRAAHLVREAWRRARFHSFLEGTRHELVELRADFEGYDANRLKAAIKLFNRGTTEERHVMLGGCVSEEQYARMHRLEPQGENDYVLRCTLCGWHGFPIGIMLLGSVDTLLEVGLPLRLPPGRGDLVGLFVEKVWRLLVPASGIWAWFGPRFVTALASVLLGAELFVTDSDILFLLTDVMVQSLLSLHVYLAQTCLR